MRFLIAAALFVVSVVSLVLGLGDRTIWAPPASHRIAVSIDVKAPYVFVPSSVLHAFGGSPVLTAQNDGTTFVAYGREADVQAWLGNADYASLMLDTAAVGTPVIKLGAEHIGISGPNPLDSDLWIDQSKGTGMARLAMNTRSDSGALIAVDGTLAAPKQIDLVWPIAHDLTYSNAMLGIGAAFFVAAAIMLIIALRHSRVKRGPRRRTPKAPRVKRVRVRRNKSLVKPKGRRSNRNPVARRIAVLPIALMLTASLAGCSIQLPGIFGGGNQAANPTASASVSTDTQPPAAVTRTQLERILTDVAKVAAAGDKANNRTLLTARFAGPAFQMRAVNYVMRKKSSKVDAMQAIAARPITFSLPAATDTWPRTIMAVTDESGQGIPPQMLVLQQATPRDNYKVWYVSRLLPGIKIPAVPSQAIGAIPVDSKSVFLKLAPLQLAGAFGDVINKGRSSLSAGLFDLSNPFYEQVSSGQKAQAAALINAKISFRHTLGDPNTLSLATANAGALVAVFMNDTYVIKPNKTGAAVAVDGQEKILLGAGGSTTGVQSVYGDMLFFYVPPVTGKTTIQLLGVTQGLLSIKKL